MNTDKLDKLDRLDKLDACVALKERFENSLRLFIY